MMTVKSTARDCPLCAASRDEHDLIHYAYQENLSYAAAAEEATRLGYPADEDQAKKHFQYHRTVQPAPRGYLKRSKALERAEDLPERLREMLVLASRVRALSGSQLAELFYWSGDDAKKAVNSARNNCYRDLRRLSLEDFLYRYHCGEDNMPDQLTAYFLGRDAAPFIEEREMMELSRRDYMTSPDQADDVRVMQWHAAAEVVCSLARQVRQADFAGYRPEVGGAAFDLSFSPLNWFGRDRLVLPFTDPFSGVEETIQPGGLAAVGFEFPERQFSVLAPFLYEHDTGSRSLTTVAEELLLYPALARSGALADRFPELPRRGYFPPVLVVCPDVKRALALHDEVSAQVKKRALPSIEVVAVITDAITLAHHGLAGQAWLSLWSSTPAAVRHRLVDILLSTSAPLRNAVSADSRLSYRAA